MSKESEEFDKKFSEIVESDDLKKISDDFKKETVFTIKEILLIQQSLMESMTHISDLLFYHFHENEELINVSGNTYHELMSSLYKISSDFNESMVEYLGVEFGELDDLDEDD